MNLAKASLAAMLLILCWSTAAIAGEYSIRVIRPDGTPIPDVGLLALPSYALDSPHPPDPATWGRAYTDENGIARFSLQQENEMEFVRLSLQTGMLFVDEAPDVSQRIRDRFWELASEYDFDGHYDFTPEQISDGIIGEIQLPESIHLRVKLLNPGRQTDIVHAYRVGGDVNVASWPRLRVDRDGFLTIPIKRGKRSVIFLREDSVAKRIVVTEDQSMLDFDYGDIDMSFPSAAGQLRLSVPPSEVAGSFVTLVSSDASRMFVFQINPPNHPVAPGAVIAPIGQDDRTLLVVPAGEYFVLPGNWTPSLLARDHHHFAASIELIASGQPPTAPHSKIRAVDNTLREFVVTAHDLDP